MSPKRARFVAEYLVDLNASAAARRAGYMGDPNTVGPRLLADVGIAAAVCKAMEERGKRLQADADWVLRQLLTEKTADLAELFDERGRMRDVSAWPEAFRHGVVVGIESFEEYEGRGPERVATGMVRKVKLADRTRHLELIGKHVGVQAWRERELLKFKLPEITSAADCISAQAAVLTAVAAGELSATQATALSGLIDGLRKCHETAVMQDVAERLQALEAVKTGRRT